MKETSPNLSYTDRIRSWARTKAHGGTHRSSRRSDPSNLLPISNPRTTSSTQSNQSTVVATATNASSSSTNALPNFSGPGGSGAVQDSSAVHPSGFGTAKSSGPNGKDTGEGGSPPSDTSPQAAEQGPVLDGGAGGGSSSSSSSSNNSSGSSQEQQENKKQNIVVRFLKTTRMILFHSKLNLLLIFVPIGIIVAEMPGTTPAVIFAMNAIAIIPLAGLLSFATETVARRLGDSLGALLNVTFGNAVELIIFIALVKNKIRIVQASLLGSILANLLLILGMSFLLGGLRFREQIYNSTVTQMSACLLSLSVISLVLPTAFHASFNNTKLADIQSLKISRGTSVILLLVYIIYLMFQLKSHAYMYKSTPQHIIDEESTPGPVAGWLDSSSSDSSSPSDSDSDTSSHSRETVSKRMRRVMRGGRRRKSSVISVDTSEGTGPGHTRTPSFGTSTDVSPLHDEPPASEESSARPRLFPRLSATGLPGDEEAIEDEKPSRRYGRRRGRKHTKKQRKHKHKALSEENVVVGQQQTINEDAEVPTKVVPMPGEPRRVDFALANTVSREEGMTETLPGGARRPLTIRGMSLRPVAKSLAPTVFTQTPGAEAVMPPVPSGPVPRIRYGIRRTNSLPDRLNQYYRPPGAMMPPQVPMAAVTSGHLARAVDHHEDDLSRTSAVLLLVISTGLVALCAEFMVDSINGLVQTSSVGEIFIGLIILPIVGNAAEHVTAITVAMKNKMDLAIGVAVGSSIQIALFITPLVVIIGWAINRDMTLYFTLFETVCLFVSAFIVNFLVLDGRSNYLEGALLLATYIIISVVAFFYPSEADMSTHVG